MYYDHVVGVSPSVHTTRLGSVNVRSNYDDVRSELHAITCIAPHTILPLFC